MSNSANVIVIAEGASEQNFAEGVLAPYLGTKGIFLQATQISKKGQKGGDVKFERAKRDIVNFLRQRPDSVVATFIDYYGVKQWPGLEQVRALHRPTPDVIAKTMNEAAVAEIRNSLPDSRVDERYFPFTAVHEFEALLFSDVEILAGELGIDLNLVRDALEACGTPEAINNKPETSPSHRLIDWTNGHYAKASHGVVIAAKIGIDKIEKPVSEFQGVA